MKILYYHWNENSAKDLVSSLQQLGHAVIQIQIELTDYDKDSHFYSQFCKELQRLDFDCIFTFDFFPLISKAAQEHGIPYISWIYDMPHTTLFSPAARNDLNHIFLFDYDLYQRLMCLDYDSHLYHLPLAVNTEKIIHLLGKPPKSLKKRYEVSFVGSLYEKCLYNQIPYLPPYLEGYLSGIQKAQQTFYGGNIIEELINPQLLPILEQFLALEIPDGYTITYSNLLANLINAKITSTERIELLTRIAAQFPFTLFSGSDHHLVPRAQKGGILSYDQEMPEVFCSSKINLNITLRSITSGIPLRALDIMGAGGFLLSNYQPELDEYFKNGEECVLFEHSEDMMEKIEYFLSHDKEREEIARNGFYKVHEAFSYPKMLQKIFSTVFTDETHCQLSH